MSTVQLSQLEKTYPASGSNPAFHAVKGINLEIADGEFMVLVGPSGCGKSTTLRMIAGLEVATAGTIRIGDRVVNDVPPKDRDIAMVFQNYALYPHMSVYENMAFGLTLRKLPKKEIAVRVRDAAALLGLEALLDRKPKALSGGQRQRVAVGRAIVRQPKVFLFDEPLSNLDAKMRVQMRAEISRLHDRLGATMIYVTHDQVEAMTMGDRICVMRDGSIEQVAEPLALYHSPASAYVAGFIGSPPMNLVPGMVQRRGDELIFRGESDSPTVTLRGAAATRAEKFSAQAAFLGFRPENIQAAAADGEAIPTVVELSEPMGAETIVHLRAGSHPIVARFRADHAIPRGTSLPISIEMEKVHFFPR